jgi:hypothetical protein
MNIDKNQLNILSANSDDLYEESKKIILDLEVIYLDLEVILNHVRINLNQAKKFREKIKKTTII